MTTLNQLFDGAKGGCEAPGCTHEREGPMYLHPRCHPKGGTWVGIVLPTRTLRVECAVCHGLVVEVECTETSKLQSVLRELADASEEAASSDSDMPSAKESGLRFDAALDAAREILG